MNLKNIILSLTFLFIINACNEQEIAKVETPKSELETDLKKLGEAFRFGARLEYAAARTNGFTNDPAEIESGMLEYLAGEYGPGIYEEVADFKNTDAYGHVSTVLSNLDIQIANDNGRLASNAELNLSQELEPFEQTLDFINVSQGYKD